MFRIWHPAPLDLGAVAPVIALTLVFACPVMPCAARTAACDLPLIPPDEKHKTERERCKRTENGRVPRGCPDGGRTAAAGQDARRSIDCRRSAPLVA